MLIRKRSSLFCNRTYIVVISLNASTDNLKISDFGLATLFRNRGQERKLFKRCGTVPYTAPEVK